MGEDKTFVLTLLIMAFLGAMAIVAIWYAAKRRGILLKSRLERGEALNRLLDKCSSTAEVEQFLKTEAGQMLLESPASRPSGPRIRILWLVQAGGVCLFIGAAFLYSAYRLSSEVEIAYLHLAIQHRTMGLFLAALGAGLLCVAYVTAALIRRWGMDSGKAAGR